MHLLHYDTMTSAGDGVAALVAGLMTGRDFSSVVHLDQWQQPVPSGGRVCFIPDQDLKQRSSLQTLKDHFNKMWLRSWNHFSSSQKSTFKNQKTLCLLSSTKGIVEDYIWESKNKIHDARAQVDPFAPLLEEIQKTLSPYFNSVEGVAVSNACASSHVALELAEQALDQKLYDHVIIYCADLIGPFIYNGFNCLKILTRTQSRPFSKDRDGLQLGEATTLLFLSRATHDVARDATTGFFEIAGVFSETEGGSVTRPSMNGKSLLRTMNQVFSKSQTQPDFFVAHGTGTLFNDTSEERALRSYCAEHHLENKPIVGTKWSIGHTLGASGALDLIAACEVIRSQRLFKFENTLEIDPEFTSMVFAKNKKLPPGAHFQSAMVTSLGFGGIHAALLVRKVSR